MNLKKLFRLLVLGGTVAGTASGCAAQAQGQSSKKVAAADAGAAPDAGAKADTGGGAPGW